MSNKETVLVTGASGYIAVHTIVRLLQAGFAVRGTLRAMSRQEEVRQMLLRAGVTDLTELSFAKADLLDGDSFLAAAAGVDDIIHLASPTPVTRPDAAEKMIKMAVEGVLNVMRAAKAANVKRMVMTSASGAVLAGHEKSHPQIFTEKDWSDLKNSKMDAYQRSKTEAERSAWNFAKENSLQLSTVLPVAVMGPILGKDYSHSNDIIRQMLTGKMPMLLNMSFDYVDVRDVADLHLLAMTNVAAIGERFLATTGENISYKSLAQLLKDNLGNQAEKVSTRVAPDFLIKFLAHFRKDLKMPATFLGQNTACSSDKARHLLNWRPRSAKEAILSTAQSFIDLKLV